jgi:hypothetical protein
MVEGPPHLEEEMDIIWITFSRVEQELMIRNCKDWPIHARIDPS